MPIKFNGEKLKLLREKVPGMTAKKLGELMNCSQSLITGYELGDKEPRADKVSALASIFKVPEITFYISSNNLDELFPNMSKEVIDFILDEENRPYIELAKRFKDNDTDLVTANEFADIVIRAETRYQDTVKKTKS